MTTKYCIKCQQDVATAEFHTNSKTSDGLQGYCKECMRAEWRAWAERQRMDEFMADKEKRKKDPVKFHTYRLKMLLEQPEKHVAREAVYSATKCGKLTRPPNCSSCKCEGRIEGHHEDYSNPLAVIWLCKPCHCKADKTRRKREKEEMEEIYGCEK